MSSRGPVFKGLCGYLGLLKNSPPAVETSVISPY